MDLLEESPISAKLKSRLKHTDRSIGGTEEAGAAHIDSEGAIIEIAPNQRAAISCTFCGAVGREF